MLRAAMQHLVRHPWALAILAGIAYAIAADPLAIGVLVFVAPILWLRAIDVAAPAADLKLGAKVGFVVGFACHVLAFYWAVPLFTEHVPIPLPIAILLAMLVWFGQALPFAAIGAVTEMLHAAKLPRVLALAIALPLGFELVWEMFPWRPAEIAVVIPVYAQIADLSGASLVDVAIVLAGAGVYEGLRTRRSWMVALGVVAFVAPTAYGVVRMRTFDALEARAEILRVGVVQPNIMQGVKFDFRLAPSHLDNLRLLTADVERAGVDLTVWPETSYPWPLPREARRDAIGRRGIHHRNGVRGSVIFGALTYGDGACDHRNSAFAMDRSGEIVGAADKVFLLPFSEHVPFYEHLPFLRRFLPCPGFVAGVGPQTMTLDGNRIGILNCYEDLLPAYAREVGREHPAFLLNLTNDGWFLDTSEPHLHHMAARLRAIETRRELLRVVNTGLSGRIDANGRRREELPVWTRGAMVAEVRLLPGTTSRFLEQGDVITPALELLAVALFARLAFLRSRRSAT